MPPPRALFVGIGSPHGDDRAGWLVADALEQQFGGDLLIRRAGTPLDLLNWLEGIDCLALCDACQGLTAETAESSDSPAPRCPTGSWRRWSWPCADLPLGRIRNSHDLGLTATLKLAAQLDQLPAQIWLWGIEIADPGPERPVTPSVAAAVTAVAADIATVLTDRLALASPQLSPHA